MNVVALVSGGKDSCYSMLLCQKHGHKVVALGNLLPADSGVDELDSYMYQTVGHQLVAAYASCTGLPLYRKRIQGHSRSQGLSYSTTAGDEVEDLFTLLAYIKEVHPEVQAVASGAIASDYQRLRVESVCSRLGLVSLGYLWHQPQEQLLAGMISNDIEAVLVKVAALGLEPHKHLGKSIRQLQPHLLRLRDRFGCNVCGEGGEYETLTLDCPAFTRGRIVLDEWEVVLHSPDSIAAVGVLHPKAFHVEQKQQHHTPGCAGGGPTAAAGSSTSLVDGCVVTEVPPDWQPAQAPATPSTAASGSSSQRWSTQLRTTVSQQHVHVTCSARAPPAAAADSACAAFSPEDTASAVDAALLAVTAHLQDQQWQQGGSTSWQCSCFVHLYLADMSHFAAANAAYCRHLPQVNPPSRACVQVPLPPGCPVLLDVLFARSGTSTIPQDTTSEQQKQEQQPVRQVLHVQSISDWAPSCIGPYSQATSCNGIIHMAGQIPLDPGSMSIVTTLPQAPQHTDTSSTSSTSSSSSSMPWTIAAQVWRTLVSCQAVAVAVKSCFATSSLGLTVYLTHECTAAGGQALVAAALGDIWRDRDCLRLETELPPALSAAAAATAAASGGGSSGNGTVSTAAIPAASQPVSAVGDGLERRGGECSGSEQQESEDDEDEGGQQELLLDDYLQPPAVQQVLQPAVVYLVVPALPRGALLEVQPLLVDLQALTADKDSSSSSSDEDEPKTNAKASGDRMPAAASVTSDSLLQQHRVLLDVVQAAGCCGWQRALLQLQRGSCSELDDHSGAASERTSQVAAVAEWLAAVQWSSAGDQLVSLRCWYDARLQDEAAHSGDGWAEMLRSRLAPGGAGGQLVPVLSAQAGGTTGGASTTCWCLIECLFCEKKA